MRIWDIGTGKRVAQLGDRSYVWHLSINAHSQILAYTSGKPCLWDANAKAEIRCYEIHDEEFGAGVLSGSGHVAAFSLSGAQRA